MTRCESAVLPSSTATIWEMQIKLQLGKLQLKLTLAEINAGQQQTNSVEVLPIVLAHVLELSELPAHHKDPFDRMLIAQANCEQAMLVSNDQLIVKYAVKVLW